MEEFPFAYTEKTHCTNIHITITQTHKHDHTDDHTDDYTELHIERNRQETEVGPTTLAYRRVQSATRNFFESPPVCWENTPERK